MDMRELIGKQIRLAREAQGMTQEDLANRLHKTRNAISSYETGNRTIPATELPELADALDVPIAYFFSDTAQYELEHEAHVIKLAFSILPEPFRKVAINQIHLVIDLYEIVVRYDIDDTALDFVKGPPSVKELLADMVSDKKKSE